MMPPGDQMQRCGRQMALEWKYSLRVNTLKVVVNPDCRYGEASATRCRSSRHRLPLLTLYQL